MAVSVVIVTYKRRASLELVLDRLAELPVDEILVVDNGVDLDDFARDGVRLIRPPRNLGIAGRNVAAAEASGELLLMLDDDAYPLPGAIEALVAVFETQPRLGVAGGFVRDVDEAGNVVRQDEVGTFDWFFRGGRRGSPPSFGWPAFFFPEGASMVRREALLDVDGFFEPFFFHCEGVDLATRLLARGWDVRYVPSANFNHMKAEAGRLRDAGLDLRVRNQLWYFWLHFPLFLAIRRMGAYLVFDLIECTERRALGAWARGIANAWKDRGLIAGSRRPLPRAVIKRAELNRGRLHIRLLFEQLRKRVVALPKAARSTLERLTPADLAPPAEITGPADVVSASRILSNTVYRSVADLGAKFASIALYVVMARKLGVDQFGIFTFGLAFATLATTLGGFGQSVVLTREVAREHARLDRYFANTLALNALLSLPILAVATAAMYVVTADTKTVLVSLLLGVGVVCELLMNTCFATFQAFERLVFIPISLITQRTVTAVVGVAALLLGADVVVVSAAYLLGAIVALGLTFALMYRFVARPSVNIEPHTWVPLMRSAVPIGMFTVFSVTLFRADTAMLTAFEPKSVVGNYGVSYRLFETTLFLCWGVGAAVYPVLSRLTATSQPTARSVFEPGLKLVIGLTLPLAVGAAVLARPIVQFIYGQDFALAPTALLLLAPTIALYPVAYICGNFLLAQDRQRVLTKMYGFIAAQNIISNLVLIPAFSLNGAAFGTSLSQFILTGLLLHECRKLVGEIDWFRLASGPVLASGAAGAAMAILRSSPGVAVAVGALTYFLALTTLENLVYPRDVHVVRDFLMRRLS